MLIAFIQLLAHDRARTFITVIGALVIACAAVFLAYEFVPLGSQKFAINSSVAELLGYVMLAIDVLLCLYIIGKGIAHKKYIAIILAIVQLCLAVYVDLFVADGIAVSHALYVDDLSVIMALIIGIVGSGIAVYALGYMRVHEAHNEGKDRRNVFFAVMFAFLARDVRHRAVQQPYLDAVRLAEITTVCSFALIGYTRTKEAIDNSFLQIVLNLIGGIAFTCALFWIGSFYGVMELDKFLAYSLTFSENGYTLLVDLPLLLLALAGFTKAAQMPFHKWLLGAMVAPTPTSALLHSSTMVKAGVFLLIKLAPCLGFNLPGYIVMIVGGATFLFCALAAISQSNAKRVLAYSTISNLGLIAACAGVGTDGAIWAAIFLVIFHAVAKSLLFLCVGTAEHHIGSRNIEDMDDLFERMPRLARLMSIGIMGMFVAPFGMLVSKWAALEAFAQSENVILILLLVFGSAATFMFWAKWLGKILAIANSGEEDVELTVSTSEWVSLGLMTVLTVGCCVGFPLISQAVVVPYLSSVFNNVSAAISSSDLWIMAVIAIVIAVVFLGFTGATKKKVVPVYMAGIGTDFKDRKFLNSFGGELEATQRNWYMTEFFDEKKMSFVGIVVTLVLLVGSFGFAAQTVSAQENVLNDINAERASYEQSIWAQGGADFPLYMQYYQYYQSYYEQNKSTLQQQMNVYSMDEFMNMLYMQMYSQQMSNSSSSSSSTGGSDSAGGASDTSDGATSTQGGGM